MGRLEGKQLRSRNDFNELQHTSNHAKYDGDGVDGSVAVVVAVLVDCSVNDGADGSADVGVDGVVVAVDDVFIVIVVVGVIFRCIMTIPFWKIRKKLL